MSDRRVLGLIWLALAILTTLPYVMAWQRPPSGMRFIGAIYYPDDFYQYLSFAEQAGRGEYLFSNKFDWRPFDPMLVNLEWWAAGLLGRWLGAPLAGFHVLRLGALAALLLGSIGLLKLARRTPGECLWGVLLVATGGGLGWLRLALGTPGWHVPDILTGLYAWHQTLFNAHFVVGTALLVWTLLLYLRWRQAQRGRWAWVLSAWLVALSRPYDLIALLITLLGVELWQWRSAGQRQALARMLELAWLAPMFVYYAVVVGAHPSFRGWSTQPGDISPPLAEYAFALGPGIALVLAFARLRVDPEPSAVRTALLCWCLGLLMLLGLWSAPMAKQCATSLGTALLLWAAVVTPGRVLPWAALALSPTSLFLLWRAWHPFPSSFAPADYFAAVEFLRSRCESHEVVLAPTDLSLLIAGLTPCHVVVGHRLLTPSFSSEVALANRFYDHATPAEWRLSYLHNRRFAYAILASGRGDWLGNAPGFERALARPLLEIFRSRNATSAGSPGAQPLSERTRG